MLYIVTIAQGSEDIKVQFKDAIRANMFAEMAAKNILPAVWYGTKDVKNVKVTIEFVVVNDEDAEPVSSEAPAEEDNTEKEDK